MTDITSIVKESQVGRSDDSVGRWVCKFLDFVGDSIDTTSGVHEVITIPANNFVAIGWFVVTTAFTSTSTSGTLQFKIGSEPMTGLMPANGTQLAAGDVVFLSPHDFEDTESPALYKTSADTLDVDIETNPITAGKGYLIVLLIDLTNE